MKVQKVQSMNSMIL